MSKRRLTAAEIVVLVLLLALLSLFIWSQSSVYAARDRDLDRKVAINAIASSLEKIYYPAHHYYPSSISATTLPGLNPKYLKDPEGNAISHINSDFRYDPMDCNNDQCTGYSLRAHLEQETDFIKTSGQVN